jgi:hypothetical protein
MINKLSHIFIFSIFFFLKILIVNLFINILFIFWNLKIKFQFNKKKEFNRK